MRPLDPPRAVTLDLWRTLISEDPSSGASTRNRTESRLSGIMAALESAGRPVERGLLEEGYRKVREETDRDHDAGRDLTFAERVRQVLEIAQPGLPGLLSEEALAAAERAMDEPFLEHSPAWHPAAGDVLSALRAMGLRVALISNTGMTSARIYTCYFQRSGLREHFDVLVFSNEVALAKPSPAIFSSTLERLGVPPGRALHVGDNLHTDIAGAKDSGMSTAWISGYDVTEPRLPPDFVLEDLSELPDVVERWMRGGR